MGIKGIMGLGRMGMGVLEMGRESRKYGNGMGRVGIMGIMGMGMGIMGLEWG